MSQIWESYRNCLLCGSGLSPHEPVKRVPGGYICEACPAPAVEPSGFVAAVLDFCNNALPLLAVIGVILLFLFINRK